MGQLPGTEPGADPPVGPARPSGRPANGANRLPERRRSLWARAFAVARLAPAQVSDPEDAANLVLKAVGVGARLPDAEVGADLEELAALSEGLRGGDRVREAVRRVRGRPGR